MKTIQYFNLDYLNQTRFATTEQILEYLEQFRLMQATSNTLRKPSKLISIKIPETQLKLFRAKCKLEGVKYQTQIKALMSDWLKTE